MNLALYHSKGGVGKTTGSVNLGDLFKERGVAIFDVDHQHATAVYEPNMPEVEFYYSTPEEGAELIEQHGRHINIIDCPPQPHLALPMLQTADVILIPFVTEMLPFREAMASLQEVQSIADACIFTFVSKHNPQDPAAKKILNMARAEFGAAMLKTILLQRLTYPQSSFAQKTVLAHAPNSDAAKRIRNLGQEILNRVPVGVK